MRGLQYDADTYLRGGKKTFCGVKSKVFNYTQFQCIYFSSDPTNGLVSSYFGYSNGVNKFY